ncbi:NALCN channel auxiliary factor 1 isoform X2 [Myiozetetes cayanensis]|uniref:NALCN channel auxiliary factor 1 isoform X2 n=1 Tax=Myiozetetes cayanensis TaxID=478635 RepID=UPI00215F3414|nr:NALCN channel auxiliary factor 1 isoform X2 [Myiozetetes cayanensis]
MTRGAWMCSRQYDDGLKIWFAPRENEKPFTDSERAQKWRLSLASLLFFTVLLSDHLWFCAEAKFTGTGEKEQPPPEKPEPAEPELLAGMGEPAPPAPRLLAPLALPPALPGSSGGGSRGSRTNGTEPRHGKAAFLGNSTTRPLETCPPPGSSSGQCFSVGDAEAVCRPRGGSGRPPGAGQSPAPGWDLTDFYLSFCNSYTLWELFAGLSNPDTLNCSLDVVLRGEGSCSQCVQAYQRYDQHAQEKYEEFEVMLQKYLQSDEYSVKSCPEDCKDSSSADSVSVSKHSPVSHSRMLSLESRWTLRLLEQFERKNMRRQLFFVKFSKRETALKQKLLFFKLFSLVSIHSVYLKQRCVLLPIF